VDKVCTVCYPRSINGGKVLEEQLDIRIEIDNERYIATTLQFPGCVGIGKNEKEALKELGKSVMSNMENNLKNVIKLIENPRIVRVKPKNLVSEKLKFLDKIFHSLGISRKARKDILKMFVNVDFKLDKNILAPLEVKQVRKEPLLLSDLAQYPYDIESIPEDSDGFIISMPINLN